MATLEVIQLNADDIRINLPTSPEEWVFSAEDILSIDLSVRSTGQWEAIASDEWITVGQYTVPMKYDTSKKNEV